MEKESVCLSDEPKKVPFKLLEEITNGFATKSKLGSGRFGELYKGVFKDGREIAVNKFRFIPGIDQKSFENEIGQLVRLKHVNIAQIVSFCDETEEVDVTYEGNTVVALRIHRAVCLDFAPKGSLGKLLSENFFGHNWHIRFKLIKGICEGLSYLHDASIEHSYLNPDTIFLDNKLVPKISDFGLPRLLGEENTIMAQSHLGSQLEFSRSESINKQIIISKNFDIFSLGVIIKRIVLSGVMDYVNIPDMEDQAFIEHVQYSWKKRLQEIPGDASLEANCKQVQTCIDISVICMETDRYKRPTMKEIICRLNQVDTVEDDSSWSQIEQELGMKISSKEKETQPSDEPKKIPFKLLSEITNGFCVEAKLGSGTFGDVYKGVLKDGTPIAMKKLRFMPEIDDMQFENELCHLKKLKHENIVQVVGFCDETEEELREYKGRIVVAEIIHRVICLEFVPNGSLGKILSEKFNGYDWQVRFKIIKGICEGLKYLHDVHIMHFDLKPDNILLDDKMVPKIADFGISRLAGEATTISTMSHLGTPGFLPPEFINRQIISKYFDIFSLGVIIKRIVVSGLNDYMSIADMEDQAFIKHVHDTWKKKLQETSSYASVEIDCKQVRTCIEIAVVCMEADRYKRPTMHDIMSKLKELETTEDNDSLSQIEEIHKGDISKTQYPGTAVSHHRVSSEMPTGDVPSLASRLPNALPFSFLREITNEFSPDREIGKGAFGTYYMGLLEDGSVISVKKLVDNSPLPPDKHFNNEVGNLMAIQHENIVKLIGYCRESQRKVIEHGGRYIIVDIVESSLCYEYLPNGNLGKYIYGESRMSWETCFKIIKGICQGLHFLHKEMVVHMNLIPENILLDDNMVPKIADFGLSRLFGEEQSRMFTQNVVGAKGYMAPEYLYRGEISMHSDIYSVGLIIMEITTGEKNVIIATGEKNVIGHYDMSGRQFIDRIRTNWVSTEQIASKYPSLDANGFFQVKACIEIGLRCVELERRNRPSITEIIGVLDGKRA